MIIISGISHGLFGFVFGILFQMLGLSVIGMVAALLYFFVDKLLVLIGSKVSKKRLAIVVVALPAILVGIVYKLGEISIY